MSAKGESITTLARVLRIVDVFDAMTSRRPYKEALPAAKAAQIMVGTPSQGNEPGKDPKEDPRDRGMKQCFDERLLRKFIVFLGKVSPQM